MKEVVDLRLKMHARILESVRHTVMKRARLKSPDAFDSKFMVYAYISLSGLYLPVLELVKIGDSNSNI